MNADASIEAANAKEAMRRLGEQLLASADEDAGSDNGQLVGWENPMGYWIHVSPETGD